MAVRRHRRYAPLNYRSKPTFFYRYRPGRVLERTAWRYSRSSRFWRIVSRSFLVGRWVRGTAGKTPQYVAIERLRPGQAIVVRAIPMATKAQRRAERASRPR